MRICIQPLTDDSPRISFNGNEQRDIDLRCSSLVNAFLASLWNSHNYSIYLIYLPYLCTYARIRIWMYVYVHYFFEKNFNCSCIRAPLYVCVHLHVLLVSGNIHNFGKIFIQVYRYLVRLLCTIFKDVKSTLQKRLCYCEISVVFVNR